MRTLRLRKQTTTRKALFAVCVLAVSQALTPVYAQLGAQQIVLDMAAAKGWTAVVPMNINDGDGLTDFLSYNATTGRAIYSVATSVPGQQQIVLDMMASKGWTAVVPMNINGDVLTDLLSYNRTTGRAVYSGAA